MAVADAIANHLSYLKSERATAYDARHWILPKAPQYAGCADQIRYSELLNWLASQPAMTPHSGGKKARPTEEGQRARKASANRTFAYL
jgi:hypothetical protein